jgi:hydroxypyruvate isomerase
VKPSTLLWPLPGSVEEKLEVVARAGLDGVGLTSEHARWSTQEERTFVRALDRLRLRVALVGATPNWRTGEISMVDPTCHQRLLSEVRSSIDAAKGLGCNLLLLLPGPDLPSIAPERKRKALLDSAARCAELAEATEVTLALESLNGFDHPGATLRTWSAALDVTKHVGSHRLRLVLDLFHEETEVGHALCRLPSALADAATVHLAGLPERTDPEPSLLSRVRSVLTAAGFEGETSFEYLPLRDPRESLARAYKDWASDGWVLGPSRASPVGTSLGAASADPGRKA